MQETQKANETTPANVTAAEFRQQDPEFQELMLNLITIHVVSELYGADCFSHSILRAPTPDMKMRMSKTVMEEYGHHMRFRGLMDELKIDWLEYSGSKPHLTTFDVPIHSWADQAVFLAVVDRAAAHQFRHFVQSPYEPFRQACKDTLKEEYGHVGLGMDAVKELLATQEGREQVQTALKKWLPVGLQSFGSNKSPKNAQYRRWGIKQDTNENMRALYYEQLRGFITQEWAIDLPADFREAWRPADGEVSDEDRAY